MSGNIYVQSLIYALILCAILPALGGIVTFLVHVVCSRLFGLTSFTGWLYLFIVNYLTFVGVVYHELSHAVFAIITLARVDHVELFHHEGDTLGSVDFTARGGWILRSIQLSLTACAPVITGIAGLVGIRYALHTYTLPIWGVILLWYLAVSIFIHMDMSPLDIKSYLKGIPFFLILFFVIALYYYKSGVELIPLSQIVEYVKSLKG